MYGTHALPWSRGHGHIGRRIFQAWWGFCLLTCSITQISVSLYITDHQYGFIYYIVCPAWKLRLEIKARNSSLKPRFCCYTRMSARHRYQRRIPPITAYYIRLLQFALIYTALVSLMATWSGLITPMAKRHRYKLEMKIDIVHNALQTIVTLCRTAVWNPEDCRSPNWLKRYSIGIHLHIRPRKEGSR